MTRDYEKARQIEGDLDQDRLESIAFRKLVNEMAGLGVDEHDDIEDAGLLEATYRALDRIDEMDDQLDELQEENEELRDRLDKLGDIGEQKTSKEQKIAAVLTYADNARENGQGAIRIYPKTVKGVADVSRRYAYDLVDDMIDVYPWAHDPSEISQYGSMEKDSPQKGVLIDFEGVHGEGVSVNKFTTASPAEEVAD